MERLQKSRHFFIIIRRLADGIKIFMSVFFEIFRKSSILCIYSKGDLIWKVRFLPSREGIYCRYKSLLHRSSVGIRHAGEATKRCGVCGDVPTRRAQWLGTLVQGRQSLCYALLGQGAEKPKYGCRNMLCCRKS